MLEKYLNIEGFLEKSFKFKSALKSTYIVCICLHVNYLNEILFKPKVCTGKSLLGIDRYYSLLD